MPYLLILIAIFMIYVYPFEGFIPLSKDEKVIMEMYSSFESNSLDSMIDDSEDGLESMLGGTEDYETMSVLGDLNGEDASDKDYADIDINNYL